MAALRTVGKWARRVAGALVVVLCVLWGTPAYAAIPPYPETGGTASAWKCTDTATEDTPPVTGQTCTVTAWEADPPAPEPEPASETASVVTLDEDQYTAIAFALGLALLVGGARLVGGWAR